MKWVCNMPQDARLDDELAAFTDQLLSGEQAQVSPEIEDLAAVVKRLCQVVDPATRPDPAFRDRLTQRLNREWTLYHQRPARRWMSNRLLQVAAVAAGLGVVLLVVSLLGNGSGDQNIEGTAWGSLGWAFVIVVAVGGLVAFVIWYGRKRKT